MHSRIPSELQSVRSFAKFYLITVTFIRRLNEVFDDTEALADDTLSLGELRQLRPKRKLPARILQRNESPMWLT